MYCYSPIDGEEFVDEFADGDVDGDAEFAVIGTCRALYPFEGKIVCLGVRWSSVLSSEFFIA